MAIRPLLAGLALSVSMAVAEPGPPAGAAPDPKQEAVERIFSERESPEEMEKAVAAAREAGVSEQAILEARFLFHVDRSEDQRIAALLPQFMEFKGKFRLADSEVFASEDDWLAVTEYAQALDALGKGDKEGFKRHITEAFWLSPGQGAAFAPNIERIRLAEAMKDVTVDFGRTYADIMTGKQVLLGDVAGESKATLLHFWSPLSEECAATIDDFLVTAEHLAGSDVAVASVLPETSAEVSAAARKMLGETGRKISGAWIVDSAKEPLSARLRVRGVPVVVLISPEGRVLFNGHPADAGFWKALARINPGITRPELRGED